VDEGAKEKEIKRRGREEGILNRFFVKENGMEKT